MKDWYIKDRIIKNTLLIIFEKKDLNKEVLSDLKEYLKEMRITEKKMRKIPLKAALFVFLDYNKSLSERINTLISSL